MTIIQVETKLTKDRKRYNVRVRVGEKTVRFYRTTNMVLGGVDVLCALKQRGALPNDWQELAIADANDADITPFKRTDFNPAVIKHWGLD